VVLDLLLEHRIAATIWLKLPKGDVWQSEIERFCQAAIAPYTIYSLHTYQDRVKATKTAATHRSAGPDWKNADWNGLETLDLSREGSNGEAGGVAILEEMESHLYNLPLARCWPIDRDR
jgi:two-component system, OmpR family, phosphate regulon sensor histidine kinase PhoR